MNTNFSDVEATRYFEAMIDECHLYLDMIFGNLDMFDEKALYDRFKLNCTFIFIMGRMAGNMSKGRIDVLPMLTGEIKDRLMLTEIFDKYPFGPALEPFIKSHHRDCCSIFGLGIYVENSLIQTGLSECEDFSFLK